jgi:hypothetical protein
VSATLDRHTRAFQAHAQAFLAGSEEDARNVRIKIDHSLRVLGKAEALTRAEGLPASLAEQAWLAALYHDVGRFDQYARYRTFSDAASENHARLGVRALLRGRMLADLTPGVRRAVLGAVFLHNAHTLPARLAEPVGLLTRVVRDSDKLDIYKVMLEHFEDPAAPNPVVVLGVVREPERYTAAILDQVLARGLGDYRGMAFENDFKLLLVGWVYDLNFAFARRELAGRGYIERLFALLPDDGPIRRLRDQVARDLRQAG